MSERTTVRLPEDLLRRAKRKAATQGRTLTALIEEGVRRVLNEHEKRPLAQRQLPDVSRARGGLMPGINLNDSASLIAAEDLDAAREF